MRLTRDEVSAIKECAARHFGAGAVVRLFGSRVRDDLRGGDIDLYITTEQEPVDDLREESRFLSALKARIGERRIDLLFSGPSGPRRPIETIALATGVILPDPADLPAPAPVRQPIRRRRTSMSNPHQALLAEALRSGDLAKQKLGRLLSELSPDLPLTPARVGSLTWDEQLRTDSLLLQFNNLVAIVQDQMIRGVLLAEEEPVARLSRLDRRHAAEKFGALPDGVDLERIADARNNVADQHPADAEHQASIINEVATLTPMLIIAFDELADFARRRGHAG